MKFNSRVFIASLMSLTLLFGCTSNNQQGQEKDITDTTPANKENRVSPAISTSADMHGNVVTVTYGSPRVKGRTIWGGLVPFGEVWRTGANEATTVTFSKDVLIDGQLLKKDTYALFTIPEEITWTVIFNLEDKQWGAFKYDMEQDALRVPLSPIQSDSLAENMTLRLLDSDNGGMIQLAWEYLYLDIPFTNAPEE